MISQEAADEFISKHPDKSATLKKAMAKRDVETQGEVLPGPS